MPGADVVGVPEDDDLDGEEEVGDQEAPVPGQAGQHCHVTSSIVFLIEWQSIIIDR